VGECDFGPLVPIANNEDDREIVPLGPVPTIVLGENAADALVELAKREGPVKDSTTAGPHFL